MDLDQRKQAAIETEKLIDACVIAGTGDKHGNPRDAEIETLKANLKTVQIEKEKKFEAHD